jgi:hypothetical protein
LFGREAAIGDDFCFMAFFLLSGFLGKIRFGEPDSGESVQAMIDLSLRGWSKQVL